MNAETLEMLAKLWADKTAREYFTNARVQQIWSLKKIKNKSIEADALELAEKNGRISFIEELLLLMRTAYEDNAKIQGKLNAVQKQKAS